jgi:GDSL-like Lipase/Acylhydrolase family
LRAFSGVTLTTLVVALCLCACGDDRPSLDLPKGSRVLFIGDSITFQSTNSIRFTVTGAGLKPDIYAVPGAAINGAPLVNWPQKITQLVAKDHPDAVVVELGTNGCGYCRSDHDGIDSVMRPLRDVPDVLWIDTRNDAPIPKDSDAINRAIRDAADRWKNLTVVDFDDLVGDEDIGPDHIHLDTKGQGHFAESLAAVLT